VHIVLLVALLLSFGAVESHSEVVKNGGFEQRDSERERPAFWHHNARNAGDLVEMGWSDEAGHSGEHSISIHIREDYPSEKADISWMWTCQAGDLSVGETYRLRAWIKTQGLGFTPTVLVQFLDASDTFLSRADTHTEYPITGTTDWTEVSSEFVVPENAAHIKIRAAVKATGNAGGTVWFDDISVEQVKR